MRLGKIWNGSSGSPKTTGDNGYGVSPRGAKHGFENAQRGWLTRNQPIAGHTPIELTENGGETWHPVSLSAPLNTSGDTIIAFPPVFWHGYGVLFTQWWGPSSQTSKAAYYTWSPSTTHWRLSSTLPLTGPQICSNFVTSRIGYTIIGSTLYRTTDGADHWHRLTNQAVFAETTQIDFVTPSTGFLIGHRSDTNTSFLFVTHDAGLRWTPIPSHIVKS